MSDNELDAELLALAGDESGEERDTTSLPQEGKRSVDARSRSSSPAAEPAVKDNHAGKSPPRRGVAQRISKSKAGSRKRSTRDDFEEDGEVSSPASEHDTLGSEAMSESDDNASVTSDVSENETLFPIEGKYRSEQDKAQILRMGEVQREELLADRAQQLERYNQDLQLRRLLQARQRDEARANDKRKRKADYDDFDDGQRKSSRQKTKSNDPLEAYKRQREQRAAGRGLHRRSSSENSRRSGGDADGSEVEWDDRAKAVATASKTGDLPTFQRACLLRTNFAQVCFWPGFEDAVTSCYTRILARMEDGKQVYRMVQIKGFTEGKPYEIVFQGKPFMTDQYMIVAYGRETMTREFICASDSKIAEEEFDRYLRICKDQGIRPATDAELQRKIDGINNMLSRKWTDQEINEKIKRQEKYKDRLNAKASRMREAAAAAKAADKPAILDALNDINSARRKQNNHDIRLAQVAQKKRHRAFQEAAHKKRLDEVAAHKAEVDALSGKSRSATPASAAVTPQPTKATPARSTNSGNCIGGFKTLKTKSMDEEIMENLDFGIEIDI